MDIFIIIKDGVGKTCDETGNYFYEEVYKHYKYKENSNLSHYCIRMEYISKNFFYLIEISFTIVPKNRC